MAKPLLTDELWQRIEPLLPPPKPRRFCYPGRPDVRGRPGRPRRRPEALYGERAYDSQPHREALRDRGIRPQLARRHTEHASGLGAVCWVVERFLSHLHRFRKLRLRTDWTLAVHDALLDLACSLICLNVLLRPQSG